MKKLLCVLLTGMMLLNLTACSLADLGIGADDADKQTTTTTTTTKITTTTTTKKLIITTAKPTTTTTKKLKPLSERIVCWECRYKAGGRIVETETAELYKELDELKCCVCGLVDGKDYKAGDYIYVIQE